MSNVQIVDRPSSIQRNEEGLWSSNPKLSDMSSSIASKVLAYSRKCMHHKRRIPTGHLRALSSINRHETPDSKSNVLAAALLATIVAGAYSSTSRADPSSATEVASPAATLTAPLTTRAEPQPRRFKTMHQPKNVMLHRMRSAAGRGLTDKYSVDWKTVLGEGAYGSVHPARLASTGEKVRLESRAM
jgi:hypothetical protein